MAAEQTETKISVATLAQPSASTSLPLTNSMFMTMPIESISSLRSLENISQSSLDDATAGQQQQQQQQLVEKNKLTEKDSAAAFGLQLLRRQSSSGWKSLSDSDKILEGDGPSSDRQLFGLTSLSQLNSDYSGFGASIPSASSVVDGKRWTRSLSRQSSVATQNTDSDASPGIKVLLPETKHQQQQQQQQQRQVVAPPKKKKLSMEDMIRQQFQLELPSTPTVKNNNKTTNIVSREFAKPKPVSTIQKETTTTTPSTALFPPPSKSRMSRATSSSTSEYKPSSSSSSETSASGGTKRKRPSANTTVSASGTVSPKKQKTSKIPPPPPPTKTGPVEANAVLRDMPLSTKAAPAEREWVTEQEIGENDVLCCKGGKSNHWPGNKRYRRLIAERRPAYHGTESKSTKTNMSNSLVDYVHAYGGRFLKGRKNQEGFFIMSKKEARRKVAQNLRESKDFKWL